MESWAIVVVSKLLGFILTIYDRAKRDNNMRRATARAIYCRAKIFAEYATEMLRSYSATEEMVKEEGSTYMPFTAGVYRNELRYEQIMEVMDCLVGRKKVKLRRDLVSEEVQRYEEEVVLLFYHTHEFSQALGLDFNNEIVRKYFCQKRKLKLLARWKKETEDAVYYAHETMKILERRLPGLEGTG